MSSAYYYYWAYKGPDYLKFAITTGIPKENDEKALCEYGRRNPYGDSLERERRLAIIIEEIEKRDKLLPNELFITLSCL